MRKFTEVSKSTQFPLPRGFNTFEWFANALLHGILVYPLAITSDLRAVTEFLVTGVNSLLETGSVQNRRTEQG